MEKKELLNRDKSKLACLIRKKYTNLFKESIKKKNKTEKYYCCNFFKKMNRKTLYKFIEVTIQGFISFLSIIVYVMGTYYDEDADNTVYNEDYAIIESLKWLEVFIAIVITIEYTIKLIRAKYKWNFVFKFLNVLDVFAVIPTYLSLIFSNLKGFGFTRIFRMVRLLRIIKIYKTVTDSRKDRNEEEKNVIFIRLLSAIFTVLAFVFLSTGIVHFLNQNFPDLFRLVIPSLDSYACKSGKKFQVVEYEPFREGYKSELLCMPGDPLVKYQAKMDFDLVFYYMVITMATVGYGDIYPDTSLMRLVIGVFVIMSIITISKQTSELNDLIKLNSEYQVAYKESRNSKHILLSGFFNKSSLIKFLNEFYHADHQQKSENIKIIIVQSDYPDKEIQSILLNPKFEENLHYIIGDIFSENTLKLANVKKAETIFLISDQHHSDSVKNDQYLILACKSLSQYSSAKIFIQFNHSQFLLHEWVDWDLAFSSQKIKMNIIVKNSFISGLSTMMMNLSSSSSSIYNYEVNAPWLLEYIHGASQEIYIIDIPDNFEVCPFHEFILKSYFNHRSLIIGVKKKIQYTEDNDIFYYIYLLNPMDYILTKEDSLIIISSTYESAQEIFNDPNNQNNSYGKFCDRIKIINTNDFKDHFRDENYNLKNKNNQPKDENEKFNQNQSPLKNLNKSNNISDINLSYIQDIQIPEIFRNRQYFKIWENNPMEFEQSLFDHYILFCKEDQLWEFMVYFNQITSDIIFFISDQHPSNKLLLTKKYFKNLVFIECSYSDQDDLIRLNLEKARHVYILTYTVENSNVSDSGILPLIKIIEENFPRCDYTLELSDELNIRYMNNKGIESDNEEDDIELNVLNENNNNNQSIKRKNEIKNIPIRLLPKFAKSDIFFCSSMESLLAFSYHNEGFLEVLSKLLGIDSDHSQINESKIKENSNMSMYRYIGLKKMKFELVINYYLNFDKPIIPIAIYRMKEEPTLKNKSPYIITNPEKNFLVNRFDRIICIGETSPNFTFDSFYESEFDDSIRYDSDSQSSEDFVPYGRRDCKKFTTTLKDTIKHEELENLNEEEILEKLKSEILNLKYFSNAYKNNDTDNENQDKNKDNYNDNRLDKEDSDTNQGLSYKNPKIKKNFFKKDESIIVEEKNEENEELVKNYNLSESSKKDKSRNSVKFHTDNSLENSEPSLKNINLKKRKTFNLKKLSAKDFQEKNFFGDIIAKVTQKSKKMTDDNLPKIAIKKNYNMALSLHDDDKEHENEENNNKFQVNCLHSNKEIKIDKQEIIINQISKFVPDPQRISSSKSNSSSRNNNNNITEPSHFKTSKTISISKKSEKDEDISNANEKSGNKKSEKSINKKSEKSLIINKEKEEENGEDNGNDFLEDEFFCLEKNNEKDRLNSAKFVIQLPIHSDHEESDL